MNTDKIIKATKNLLTAIYGNKWKTDPNFIDTPERVSRSFAEILKFENDGQKNIALHKCFQATFPSEHTSIIFAPNIITHSMCPHHLLPVSYNMTIAYIPKKGGQVVGASKLERIARILSARAILQEDLTKEISDTINKALLPLGVAVVTSGIHDCMRVRGIKTKGSFEVSSMSGSFKENESTRAEFFSLMQLAEMKRR